MALLRIKNPEQIKTGNVGDLGILLGLDRCPEVKTIRRKLHELGLQNRSLQFMENLSRAWIEQDEEITGLSGWVVRHLMDVSDVTKESWRKKAIEKTAAQAFEGGGWMVITSPDNTVSSLIDAGRRFQRMALLARSRGIGIHPMTQTLEEPHGKQQIRENHDAGMIPQFMLRVGYVHPYPAPVSLRRPVEWFLV